MEPHPANITKVDYEEEIKIYVLLKNNTIENSKHVLESEPESKPKLKQQIPFYENIPFIIKDIHLIQLGEKMWDKSTFYGVSFRTISIYGFAFNMRIKSTNKKTKGVYLVDDGTASVMVHNNWNDKDIKDIANSIRDITNHPDLKNITLNGHSNKNKKNHIDNKNAMKSDKNTYVQNSGLKKLKNGALPDLKRISFKPERSHIRKFKEHRNINEGLGVFMKNDKHQVLGLEKFSNYGTKVLVTGIPFFHILDDKKIHLYALEILVDNGTDRSKEILFKRKLIQFYEKNILN